MIGFSSFPVLYLYSLPTDMRKSFDGLTGLVTTHLRMNPQTDGAFIFVNKSRNRMKILVWDRHGFWLMYKRLESGRFQVPPVEQQHSPSGLRLSGEQLLMIIEGIDLASVRRRKRYISTI